MLHFRYIVFSLFEYFQCDQFFAHLSNCSRSEFSCSSCEFCWLFLPDNAFIFNVEKNNRFSLNILYGSKTVYEIIKSDEQRRIKFVTVLNQSYLIILFTEVFVRFFCHHFYLVSLDFLFLPEQTAKGISKRERFFMHLCLFLKVFWNSYAVALFWGI